MDTELKNKFNIFKDQLDDLTEGDGENLIINTDDLFEKVDKFRCDAFEELTKEEMKELDTVCDELEEALGCARDAVYHLSVAYNAIDKMHIEEEE